MDENLKESILAPRRKGTGRQPSYKVLNSLNFTPDVKGRKTAWIPPSGVRFNEHRMPNVKDMFGSLTPASTMATPLSTPAISTPSSSMPSADREFRDHSTPKQTMDPPILTPSSSRSPNKCATAAAVAAAVAISVQPHEKLMPNTRCDSLSVPQLGSPALPPYTVKNGQGRLSVSHSPETVGNSCPPPPSTTHSKASINYWTPGVPYNSVLSSGKPPLPNNLFFSSANDNELHRRRSSYGDPQKDDYYIQKENWVPMDYLRPEYNNNSPRRESSYGVYSAHSHSPMVMEAY
eukprot:Platyproteum_vivax@DN15015_c0_g1_i1.p1